jgi:hypothetical protein
MIIISASGDETNFSALGEYSGWRESFSMDHNGSISESKIKPQKETKQEWTEVIMKNVKTNLYMLGY